MRGAELKDGEVGRYGGRERTLKKGSELLYSKLSETGSSPYFTGDNKCIYSC